MSIRAVHHLNCGTMCPVGGFLVGHLQLSSSLVAPAFAACRSTNAVGKGNRISS